MIQNPNQLQNRIEDNTSVTEYNNRILYDILMQLRELNEHLREQKAQSKISPSSTSGHTNSFGPG